MSDASSNIAELTAKLKKLGDQVESNKATESELKRHVSEWKNKHTEMMKECQYVKRKCEYSN